MRMMLQLDGRSKIMEISHFVALTVFAFCVSIVFSLTSKDAFRERLRYGVYLFFSFLLVALALSWLMFLLPR
jgi:hypothetical protein